MSETSLRAGVRAAFNKEVVKAGRLERKHGELYNRLFRDRQEGDYIEFTKFDAAYVQQLYRARGHHGGTSTTQATALDRLPGRGDWAGPSDTVLARCVTAMMETDRVGLRSEAER